MLIIIFFFTVVAFLGFNEEFTSKVDRTPLCDNLLSCFLWIFNYGLRSAAFMEDAFLTERTVPRLIFDLLFFFLVIILALNLIFGIILDNFGKLRQKKNEIERDKENRCFVCSMGIDPNSHKSSMLIVLVFSTYMICDFFFPGNSEYWKQRR